MDRHAHRPAPLSTTIIGKMPYPRRRTTPLKIVHQLSFSRRLLIRGSAPQAATDHLVRSDRYGAIFTTLTWFMQQSAINHLQTASRPASCAGTLRRAHNARNACNSTYRPLRRNVAIHYCSSSIRQAYRRLIAVEQRRTVAYQKKLANDSQSCLQSPLVDGQYAEDVDILCTRAARMCMLVRCHPLLSSSGGHGSTARCTDAPQAAVPSARMRVLKDSVRYKNQLSALDIEPEPAAARYPVSRISFIHTGKLLRRLGRATGLIKQRQ
jgi:hypothetical protein